MRYKKETLWKPQKDYNKDYYTKKRKLDRRFGLLRSTKHSAKVRGLENTLVLSDIIIPKYCPILGYKLSYSGREDDSPSVDRVDSTRGYTKDNIQVISYRANTLKSNMTIEECRKLLSYFESKCER